MRGAKFAQDRVYINGQYVKVADRHPAVLWAAEKAGTLVIRDQPYMKGGSDRRRWSRSGDYLGVTPL